MNLALLLSKAAALKKRSSNYSTTTNSDCVDCFIQSNSISLFGFELQPHDVEQGSKNSDTVQPISAVSTIYSIAHSATRTTESTSHKYCSLQNLCKSYPSTNNVLEL